MSKKQLEGFLTYSVDGGETWEAIGANRAKKRGIARRQWPRKLRMLAFGSWRRRYAHPAHNRFIVEVEDEPSQAVELMASIPREHPHAPES